MMTTRIHLLTLLAATSMLAACAVTDESADMMDEAQKTAQQAVSFDAYLNRGTTRGGAAGELTTSALQTNGFGVFAYYTDNTPYTIAAVPNFMYNQQVTYTPGSPGKWEYSPVKYWPNETGATAQSGGVDYLSFFAYAPYAEVNTATGIATTNPTTGIAAVTRANESGHPYVRYYVSTTPAQCVDLCRATPKTDQVKPAITDSVRLAFTHALAALNVQVDADIDVTAHPSAALDANTRIYVRSVTFKGFAMSGQLDLSTGTWNRVDCDCDLSSEPVTIYDGRRDNREGLAASLNETPQGLNSSLVQSGVYTTSPSFTSTTTGVTATTVNLFSDASETAPIYVIPTNDPLRVTITYDVETYDPKLVTNYLSDGMANGTSVENTITADIKDGGGDPIILSAGKKYILNLHLGLTSVKVSASITAWADGDNAAVNLPNNE